MQVWIILIPFICSHPDFVPIFLEDYSQAQRDEAKAVCGNDNVCTVDYLATKDAELATSSSNTSAESDSENQEFGKFIDCLKLHLNI